MDSRYINLIAEKAGCKSYQVANCIMLLEEGDTIPFISRYRKEQTGSMDDGQVSLVKHLCEVYTALAQRKQTVLDTIGKAGKLTPELREQIEQCVSPTALEDLYLPFRPKRRTRATDAAEKGLTPLADLLWELKAQSPSTTARGFLSDGVRNEQEALSGASDILAERFSEQSQLRAIVRKALRGGKLVSKQRKGSSAKEGADKWRSYSSFSYPLRKIPSHNLLAILRGEDEGVLSVEIDFDASRCSDELFRAFLGKRAYPRGELASFLKGSLEDSLSRLLVPSITAEVIREAKVKADEESVRIFGDNLTQLLLEAPLGQKRVLSVDPGFRNGCKLAVLDSDGSLLDHTVIFPHPPQSKKIESLQTVQGLVDKYGIEAIALGNGTASRETADFLKKIRLPEGCTVHLVSEDGASIYSASEAARKEFPNEDVTVRGAVSIGRRLQDPLAELVKIDPKSLGVGQYQHDVDQKMLREKLQEVVEHCVNLVGVDLGTASSWLLSYVSGIGPSLAEGIVAYRTENGAFASRQELLKVPRLGAKTFEQCAGFLRIRNAANPLDNSAVHPESYPIVDRMAADLGVSARELVGNASLCAEIKPEKYIGGDVGLPTVMDIIAELQKPGRDPRESSGDFHFSEEVRDIADLREGMTLPGIITNVTAFGAFVDVGVHENGLIHVSAMGHGRNANPASIVKLHQRVTVQVLSVDLDRSRISLKLVS